MVRGSGSVQPSGGATPARTTVRPATGHGRSGEVRTGEWVVRRWWNDPECSLAARRRGRIVTWMQLISPPRPSQPLGSLVGGTLFGAILVAAGLALAYLTMETPFVDRLVPSTRGGSDHVAIAMGVWSFALIAGGAFLVSGTSRLAATVARVRSRASRQTPVARILGTLPPDVVVATGVVPIDGRPIPELVIGPFGVAVVHELPPRDRMRQVGASWEIHTKDGWAPTEHPLDRAARDAERVRHWLAHGDLDFIVRVHAAVVAVDTSLPRSPVCAVIGPDQIVAWLASLPSQRSLSAGRRNRLVALVRSGLTASEGRIGW